MLLLTRQSLVATFRSQARVSIAWAFVALAAGTAAHANDQSARSIQQELAGVELVPLTFNLASAPSGQQPPHFQVGGGGTLRLLRHRWERGYLTPVQGGLFVRDGRTQTILLHVGVEGGLIVRLPGHPQEIELGLGAGAGIVAIGYSVECDGTCNLGGVGPLLSPVARYLIRNGPRLSIGVTVRGMIPLNIPTGDWFGYYTGRAILFLAALDLAFGR